jgi:type IV secretion system protein VirB3
MGGANEGVIAEPLFVAVTRPPMRWGVTYAALLVNFVVTMEVFLLSKNLLTLLLAVPIHAVCALLCLRDPRCFDLLLVWGRTRLPGYLTSTGYWRAGSASPLALDLPDASGRRRGDVWAVLSRIAPRGPSWHS